MDCGAMNKKRFPWAKLGVLVVMLPTLPFVMLGFAAGFVWLPLEAGWKWAGNVWDWMLDR